MWSRALIIFSCWGILAVPACSETTDSLWTGFENPPASARPRVWWHWIDGNVSEEGIRQDLMWLHRTGVRGVQNFDAALGGGINEPLVAERVAYLTPRWRELFRYAVDSADQLGMEFAIAASPGWSQSGGPWVEPRQGMKKFVWSEIVVEGGEPLSGPLPAPPRITGPMQDLPFVARPFAAEEELPEYYADAAVVAFPAPEVEASAPDGAPTISSSAGGIDGDRLSDGDLAQGVSLPFGDTGPDWIQFDFGEPRRIQSITVAVERPDGGTPSDMPTGAGVYLAASDDGQSFRRVVDIPRSGAAQQTLAFAPVTARVFRLVLERPEIRPGVMESLGMPAPPPPTAHRIGEIALHSAPRVHRFEDKAGFSTRAIDATEGTPEVGPGEAIARSEVLDVTAHLQADGTLDWTPPPGRWVILRLGYSLTGRTNHPASREGTGLEVDKLNAAHVKAYFDDYIGEYVETLGDNLIGDHGLQYMLTDSYEAGTANWTDDVLEQFETRRGYDPRPFLPALAGRVVVDSASSDRFLWDFRQTLGDLIADEYYGELSNLLHERGMGRYGESHEGGRAFIGDGMQVKKSADVPMGALWTSAPWPHEFSNNADIRESASVAHIYGQNIVAAESLTAFGNSFAYTPELLKPHADRAMAMGLNRFVIHTSVHQPDNRLGPGVTLGPFGQWFTRHETWAEQAGPWVEYLSRSSFLLQQGHFVADVAYLYGEGNNITNLFNRGDPPIPAGYNFDYINADAVINKLSVSEGKLVTPSGMQYAVLALDSSTRVMTLPLLRKLRDLVDAGATVVGARPESTPSLVDDAAEFDTIVAYLWDVEPGGDAQARVLTGTLSDALGHLSLGPDCLLTGAPDASGLHCVHRKLEAGDLFFIRSGSDDAQEIEATLRVTGKTPELWHADSGTKGPASYRIGDDHTTVPLRLDAHGTVFVVFREPAAEPSRIVPEPVRESLAELNGPWDITFPPEHGAPAAARFDQLASWTSDADPGIRYFSGTADYSSMFTVEPAWLDSGSRVFLNLGDVKNLAEVTVNGQPLGVLWKKPFIVDVSDHVHPGENRLEIAVTNVWPNRIIGDKQPGAQRIAYSTFDPYTADSPLLPSGLMGPVTLETIREH